MSEIDRTREAAALIRQHLVGSEGQPGAQQAVESAQKENETFDKLAEELRTKLREVVGIVGKITVSKEVLAGRLTEGRTHVEEARRIANEVFDSQNSEDAKQAVGAAAERLVASIVAVEQRQQGISDMLQPIYDANHDVQSDGAIEFPGELFDLPAAEIQAAQAAVDNYEQRL